MRIVRNAAIGLAAVALTWSGMAYGQSQSSSQSNQTQSDQSGQSADTQRRASPKGAEGGSSTIATPDDSVLGRGTKQDVQREQSQQGDQSKTGSSKSSEQTGGFGQSKSSSSEQGGMKADKASQDFIKKVADSNQKEVEISRLAEQKAQNPAVRELARQLVRDHEQLSTKLQRVATDLGVTVPSAATGEDKEQKKLSKETGANFDKKFMSWIVDEHKKDVSTFEKEADKEKANPQIKTFASDSLPQLRHHLMRAESVQQQVQNEKGSKSEQSGSQEKGSQEKGSQEKGSQEKGSHEKGSETGGYGSSGSQSGSSGSGGGGR